MDGATVAIIVGLGGLVVSVCSFFAGSRKANNKEIAEQARFSGIVETKLDGIKEDIRDLKKSLSEMSEKTENLYEEINRQIKEHEEKYHQ